MGAWRYGRRAMSGRRWRCSLPTTGERGAARCRGREPTPAGSDPRRQIGIRDWSGPAIHRHHLTDIKHGDVAMAITQAMCTSFKVELMQGIHNFSATGGDSFKIALYTGAATLGAGATAYSRSEEHTSELQSLMRSSYAVFCLKKK